MDATARPSRWPLAAAIMWVLVAVAALIAAGLTAATGMDCHDVWISPHSFRGECVEPSVGFVMKQLAITALWPVAPSLLLAYLIGIARSRTAARWAAVFGIGAGIVLSLLMVLSLGSFGGPGNALLIAPAVVSAFAARQMGR